MARDDAVVEFVQKIVLALCQREGFVGEIAEREDWLAGRAQPPEQRDIFLDRFAKRLDPALVEHPDFLGEFGKLPGLLGDRGGEILDGVGMRYEVHRERGREKPLHQRLVVEDLGVEVARIPAHKNVADVKDDDQGICPWTEGCKWTMPRSGRETKKRTGATCPHQALIKMWLSEKVG